MGSDTKQFPLHDTCEARETAARVLLDSSPVGASLWDAKINLLACNQAILRMFGCTDQAEMHGRFCELMPELQPDGRVSRDVWPDLLHAAFAGTQQHFKWLHRTIAGEALPTEKIMVRIPWEGGWCVAIYTIDLRERSALQEVEEYVRILLDATPLGASLWDEHGNNLLCNQESLSMFGLASKDEYMENFYSFNPQVQPDGTNSMEKREEYIRLALATGRQQYKWMHITASGEPFPTEKTLIRIPWKDGWRLAAYTSDVRGRLARLEAEEGAKVFLDAIPMGTILFDLEHNPFDCNQTCLRMFGCPDKAEFMTRFHEFSPECQQDGTPSREKANVLIRLAFEQDTQEFEWMHLTKTGDPLPVEVTLLRMPWKGRWCIAACIRDLRERMARRAAEERAQSLEVISKASQLASQAKSEFLAKMSHELRTPLNAVIGFLGLELQHQLPKETTDNLETSLDACHNLLHLIDDILDISKIETGSFELSHDNYRLASFIEELVRLNLFRLESTQLHFHLEIDENLPSWLYGDDLRIKQVLNNLLSNAFKYTAEGAVTLGIGLEPREETQAGSLPIRFSVRDTGKGIEARNLERLFTSYTRFDSKTNRLIEGTGLGLAISKGLVEKMGGRMVVSSEYGKGSLFACIIPQLVIDPTPIGKCFVQELTGNRASLRRETVTRRAPWQCSHMPYARVLVVDDVPANLGVARGMLQRYGMTVECVSSGREAIERIRYGQHRYHAIFMDHMMPGMDGIETLRWIRGIKNDYASSVPIIILTANVVVGNEKKFLDLGFQAFLGKPIDPTKLDAVLNRWVKDPWLEAGLRPVSPAYVAQDATEPPPAGQEAGLRLGRIDGLDMDEALMRFGSEANYLEVLQSYAVNTPQLVEQMRHLTEEDMDACALSAHGMKGASFGVGAHLLGAMANNLERAAASKNWQQVQQAMPLFLETADKLLHDIGALLHAHGARGVAREDRPHKDVPDRGELVALYEASLSCSHSSMEARLRNLEQYQYQTGGELITWLRARVDALDYEQINERLEDYAALRQDPCPEP